MRTTTANTEETLGDLVRRIWAGRAFVLAGLVVGALCAFGFMSASVPHVKASMTLAPASPMNMAAAMQGEEAQAAAGADALNFERFESSFKGAAVAELLLRAPEITAGLARDTSFFFQTAKTEWSAEELAAYIARRVTVDPVGETRLRTLNYRHPDKAFAVVFLQRLHNITDGLIRHGMRQDVNARIAYLNKAIAETMNPDHRRAMTELLMEQERLKMLVSMDQPYTASVVVPASASAKAAWPDPALIYAAFMGVCAFLGFVVFSARNVEMAEAQQSQSAPKQQSWFSTNSGNSNDRRGPLTGQKAVETNAADITAVKKAG